MRIRVYPCNSIAGKIEVLDGEELVVIMQIQGRDRSQFPHEMAALRQLRSTEDAKRLDWHPGNDRTSDTDEFDERDPLHVLSMRNQSVIGCLRLLPTTGPTPLKARHAMRFETSVSISSPLIVELSRFTIARGAPEGVTRRHVCRTTVGLAVSTCEILSDAGIQKCIALYDDRLLRIYKRIGWTPELVARSRDLQVCVGLWPVSRSISDRMRSLHKIFATRDFDEEREPFGGFGH